MPEYLDMEHYPRKDHFRHFCSMQNPYVSLTVPVDVTELLQACKRSKNSFYLTMIHAVANAANAIEQFRQRIRGEAIVQYDRCITSHIELLEDETYCYCNLRHDLPLADYLTMAETARTAARNSATIEEEAADVEGMFFVSCLPWLHFTAISEATGNDSNPRFSWGKYEANFRGRMMLPLSVTVHHGLADGLHIARFYQQLDMQMHQLTSQLYELGK